MYIKHEIGKLGEDLACEYLEKNGYTVLERNFFCNSGEIDIVAKDWKNNEIVFVEVKTRSNFKYGSPVESVHKLKQKRMLYAIRYYIYLKKYEKSFIRIDVIEVFINKKSYRINHLKQVL